MVEWTRRALLGASGPLVAGCATWDAATETPTDAPGRRVRHWPTAGYDAGNTGHVPAAAPPGRLTESWRFRADNRTDILGQPVVDGSVFAGSGRTVYALSPADGSERWATETEFDTGFLAATVANGTLLTSGLAPDGGALLALDVDTGDVEWRYRAPVATAPTVAHDRVYVGTADADRALVALDVATGEAVWTVPFGDRAVSAARSAPAVDGRTVSVTTRTTGDAPSTVLQAVEANGTERWSVAVSGKTEAAPVADGGRVYFVTREGTLHAVGADAGDERWSTTVPGPVYSSPAVDRDRVYIGTFDAGVYAVDRATGAVAWETSAALTYSDPAVTDGTVLVGGETVRGLDAADGTERLAYDMFAGGHTEYTSPAVVDGRVLVGACIKEKRHQGRYTNLVVALGDGA